jgi:hypothetical protein
LFVKKTLIFIEMHGTTTTKVTFVLSVRRYSVFDVFLTVHHRINLFYLPTWCTIPLLYNICFTLNSPTCFEQYYAHLQEVKIVLLQRLVSSALYWCTVQPLTESDDTRCCINTIWTFWRWAYYRSKHVEISNVIHILQNKAIVHQVGDKNKFTWHFNFTCPKFLHCAVLMLTKTFIFTLYSINPSGSDGYCLCQQV